MPVVIDWSGWDVSKTEPPLTDGNLALDVEPMGEVAAHLSPISGDTSTETAEPVEGKEPGRSAPAPEHERGEAENVFPLKAQRFKRMDKMTLASMLRAFKESCRRCEVSYSVKEDKQGRPRIELSSKEYGIAFWGLSVKLGQEPELEAALLIELSRKDQHLKDVLEERAAIRVADGLRDDDMTVALLTIGIDPDNYIPWAGGLGRYLTQKPKSQESEEQAKKRAQMGKAFLDYEWEWDELS